MSVGKTMAMCIICRAESKGLHIIRCSARTDFFIQQGVLFPNRVNYCIFCLKDNQYQAGHDVETSKFRKVQKPSEINQCEILHLLSDLREKYCKVYLRNLVLEIVP